MSVNVLLYCSWCWSLALQGILWRDLFFSRNSEGHVGDAPLNYEGKVKTIFWRIRGIGSSPIRCIHNDEKIYVEFVGRRIGRKQKNLLNKSLFNEQDVFSRKCALIRYDRIMRNFKCEINYHFSPSERILVRNPRFIMCDGCADRGSDWSVA